MGTGECGPANSAPIRQSPFVSPNSGPDRRKACRCSRRRTASQARLLRLKSRAMWPPSAPPRATLNSAGRNAPTNPTTTAPQSRGGDSLSPQLHRNAPSQTAAPVRATEQFAARAPPSHSLAPKSLAQLTHAHVRLRSPPPANSRVSVPLLAILPILRRPRYPCSMPKYSPLPSPRRALPAWLRSPSDDAVSRQPTS